MMFKSPLCITPMSVAAHAAGGRVTWVKSQWELCRYPGHFCVEINKPANGMPGHRYPLMVQTRGHGRCLSLDLDQLVEDGAHFRRHRPR